MNLDLIHLHELGARLFSHDVAVAGGGGLVGGGVVLQVGAVLGDELLVRTQAAGREDDSFGVIRRFGAGIVGHDAGHDAGVVDDETLDLAVLNNFDVTVLDLRLKAGHDGCSHGRAVSGTVAALDRHAAGARDVVQPDA